jgi:hypothetical protein
MFYVNVIDFPVWYGSSGWQRFVRKLQKRVEDLEKD